MFKKKLIIFTTLLIISDSVFCVEKTNFLSKKQRIEKVLNKIRHVRRTKDYQGCIRLIDEFIKDYEKFENDLIKSGAELKGELKDIRTNMNKLLSDLWCRRAFCNIEGMGLYQQALFDCEEALLRNEHNSYAYYLKGYSYSLLGDQKKAVFYIKKAAKKGCKIAQEEVEAYNL